MSAVQEKATPTAEQRHAEAKADLARRRAALRESQLSPGERERQEKALRAETFANADVWRHITAMRSAERELACPRLSTIPAKRNAARDIRRRLDETQAAFAEAAADYEKSRNTASKDERDRLRQRHHDLTAMLAFVEFGRAGDWPFRLSAGIADETAKMLKVHGLAVADMDGGSLVGLEPAFRIASERLQDARARLVKAFGDEEFM